MERELRRYQDTLYSIGSGVLIFSVWTVLRTILQFVFERDSIRELIAEDASTPASETEVFAFLFMVIIILAADLSIRIYVGTSARAEGRGNKRGTAYLFCAALMILLHAFSIYLTVTGTDNISIAETIVSIVIEFTASAILIDLIRASVRVKQLKKSIPQHRERPGSEKDNAA